MIHVVEVVTQVTAINTFAQVGVVSPRRGGKPFHILAWRR